VLISDRSKGLGSGALLSEMDMFSTRSDYFDQIVILQSYSVVDSVLRRMDLDVYYFETHRFLGTYRKNELYHDSPFRVVWDKGHLQPLDKPIYIRIMDSGRFEIESDELEFP
jgi:tyrosine-protein kinase Etk/Wzc